MISYPIKAVWEITTGCNMCCMHCGSTCNNPLPNELTTKQALKLCDEFAELHLQCITLSGGEPFTRNDWHIIAGRLTNNGIETNIVTNGWLINNDIVDKAKMAEVNTICISIDGHQKTHDLIRKPRSYERSISALQLLKKAGMPTSCITCINSRNWHELSNLKDDLINYGVSSWQVQLALPMGNLLKHPELIIQLKDIPALVKFCHRVIAEGKITMHIGDNIGYYSQYNEECIRQYSQACYDKERNDKINFRFSWQGCHAGKRMVGVRADGGIIGCLAIRNPKYIEGNVTESSLKDIWTNPKSFAWNRQIKQHDLQGFCKTCKHGESCLGGCMAQKIAYANLPNAENPTCLYKLSQMDGC